MANSAWKGLSLAGLQLGDWATQGTVVGGGVETFTGTHIYQAATDGFVMAYGNSGGVEGFTDSSNPPTTQRITNYGTAINGGLCMPVKRGDYWKVNWYGSGTVIYWIPLQASSISWAPPGMTMQVVNYETGAYATGSTAIPNDDTIPQNTEGDEYMTLAITPKSATNKLRIDILFNYGASSNGQTFGALFQDSTANALAAVGQCPFAGELEQMVLTHYMTAGTTSATTFKFRAGQTGTLYMNGYSGARKLGGVSVCSITITEIAA